ncbi:hypothetical protein ACQKMN_14080 [Ureibacillus composti]
MKTLTCIEEEQSGLHQSADEEVFLLSHPIFLFITPKERKKTMSFLPLIVSPFLFI